MYTKVTFTKLTDKKFGFGTTDKNESVFFPPSMAQCLKVGTAYACKLEKGTKGLSVKEVWMRNLTWTAYEESEQPVGDVYFVEESTGCFVCKRKYSKKGVITEHIAGIPDLPEVKVMTSFGLYLGTVKVVDINGVEYKVQANGYYHLCVSNLEEKARELEAKMEKYGALKYYDDFRVKDESKLANFLVSDTIKAAQNGVWSDNGSIIMDALEALPATVKKQRIRVYDFDGEVVKRVDVR